MRFIVIGFLVSAQKVGGECWRRYITYISDVQFGDLKWNPASYKAGTDEKIEASIGFRKQGVGLAK